MIRLENIDKTFNKGTANEIAALRDINLSINKNEFVTLIGVNGSGKSTLLNLIAGTFTPDNGTIIINKQEVTGVPEHRRSKSIARVFQNPLAGTASDLTILENFRLASVRAHSKQLKIGTTSAFMNVVKEKIAGLGLGLENKLNQPMGTLSGGQRQALTLLMSVMDNSDILLLDEPAAALDPRTAELIMRIAGELVTQYQLTAVHVTHNLKDAANYGTRIIQMNEGVIVRDFIKSDHPVLSAATIFEWFE